MLPVGSSRTGRDELGVDALLVGLLSEPECLRGHYASTARDRHRGDSPAVAAPWRKIDSTTQRGICAQAIFSRRSNVTSAAARQRLADLPQPLEFSTEHVLLGLAAADHEVSVWLRQKGLDPDPLQAEICRLHGFEIAVAAIEDLEASDDDRKHTAEDEGRESYSLVSPSVVEPTQGHQATVTGQFRRASDFSGDRDASCFGRCSQSGPRGTARGRGLCPLRVGRWPPDRTVQAVTPRSDRRPEPNLARASACRAVKLKPT